MKTARSKNILPILVLLGILASLLGSAAFPTSARAASTWYVATTGNDVSDCSTPSTPCATINGAIGKAVDGDTIEVAVGTYTGIGTEVVLISKSVTLSGGWDASFTTQNGMSMSTIDGQRARRCFSVNQYITATVDHFTIQNGYTISDGGGIYNSGTMALDDSIVKSNIAEGFDGGGIQNWGILTINNSTISWNKAGQSEWSGGGGGGGINNHYMGTLTLNNSTVSNNTIIGGFSGSGIYANGTVTLNNSTVSGNTGGVGDGLYTSYGTLTLNNSTISNNETYGFYRSGGNVILQNTIVAGNHGDSDCYNSPGYGVTVTSHGYNLIGKSDQCSFTPTKGDLAGTSASPIDAHLGQLGDYGGSTFTHALAKDSPALDAGNPTVPGSSSTACLAADQRGITRPVGSACDIGAYEGSVTIVQSVKRANASPTSASNVNFEVTFTDQVTGVDVTDFALTTTGVTDASIKTVTGSGAVYTVTVMTGSRENNGTIRLDVVDDNSILDTVGNPLGGLDGNSIFTVGEVYEFIVIPTPQLPSNTILNEAPTYKWKTVPRATQYRYQVWKDTTRVFSKTISSNACTTSTCANTPANTLGLGSYRWKVQAMVNGVWKDFSAYKAFVVAAPKAGLWTESSSTRFYVVPNRRTVKNFSMRFWVSGGCTSAVTPSYAIPVSIVGGKFSFDTGTFYVRGTFNTISRVNGTMGLRSFYVPGCGYVNGGPWKWVASWKNASQPTITAEDEIESILITPMPEALPGFITIEPVTP